MRRARSDAVRSLAERLVETPSVSPDASGENGVADLIAAALPSGIEHGAWPMDDGRRVLWARLRGRGGRAQLVLGHFDTVGADEYAALGDAGLAFRPRALMERLLRARDLPAHAADLARDLDEERRHPGTWFAGRGGLDMKCGIAAGIAALGMLAEAKQPPVGDVLLVLTPDEEHESAGMLAAVPHLARLAESSPFAGALNLDYTTEPAAYAGVLGKTLVGIWVRGVPAHAGDPFAGMDAIQIAAVLTRRLATSAALRDAWEGRIGPPPVALKLRDLKSGYNVQTAGEVVMEWNLLSFARPLERTMEWIEREVRAALEDLGTEMRALSGGSAAWRVEPEVRSFASLASNASPLDGEDARAFSLRAVREAALAAGLEGPLVVPYVLPPFYPAALPGTSPWVRAASAWLDRQGVPTRPLYPFISDMSYLAWRGEPEHALEAHMPAWRAPYRLPIEAMRALDLDVMNLGPWGRDAHGLGERAHAGWAFERLPGLIRGAIEAGLGS